MSILSRVKSFFHISWQICVKLFYSIFTDLKCFSEWWQVALIILICGISITFSFIDFNHFLTPETDPSVYSWSNDNDKGLESWRRGLMVLSGIASFSGIMSVILTSKGKYSSYFWGIINCITYGLFAFAYGYAGDAQLNIMFFLPLQFIGLYAWKDNLDSDEIAVPRSLKWWQWFLVIVFSAILSIAFYYEIPPFTESITGEGTYPYQPLSAARILDSSSNALNIVAQILLTYRFWQQWILWIIVDCMQIAMFTGVGGFGININIVVMWCIFLLNALYGLYSWFMRWYKTKDCPLLCTALVIGKFYPLHNGHLHLIEKALCHNIDKLNIIICYRKDEYPSRILRIKWMNNCILDMINNLNYSILESRDNFYKFKDIEGKEKVIFIKELEDREYDQVDSSLWAKLTLEIIDCPNIVFTSEDYGYTYAKCLSEQSGKNCVHIQVDKERKTFPISGTMVRSDALKYKKFIPKLVHKYYNNRKIVILGPESTGKTTLCKELSNIYETLTTHEYGRDITVEKYDKHSYIWTDEDFIKIVDKQIEIEENIKDKTQSNIYFCDTDILATSVWYKRYMNKECCIFDDKIKNRLGDLYLLTDPTMSPFVQDGYRDGEHLRLWMFNEFIITLEKYKCKYKILRGTFNEQKEQAQEYVNSFLEDNRQSSLDIIIDIPNQDNQNNIPNNISVFNNLKSVNEELFDVDLNR